MSKPNYDTTLARIAGNIAGNLVTGCEIADSPKGLEVVAAASVALARAIVAEVKRTTLTEEPR